ncbi:MAG TPA: IucA/IucC family protein [Oxalicibacterium sp.]|uniref:IucA/IucC family protein n=1 Tax=Oxalicibacterium sp. TaxID=2766525 RepID=UPI002C8063BB|nr:IucA/IucC family protein [Oxalicibacterium sp.]HWU97130.1 IucA/IucC family protein [Oxalicibacterium sp.]
MQTNTYKELIASQAYRTAGRRVLRQLLEALLFERALPAPEADGELVLTGSGNDRQPVSYRCRLQHTDSFGRIRIVSDILRVDEQGNVGEANDPALFLQDVRELLTSEPGRLEQFAAELLATQIKDAHSLFARHGKVLRGEAYDVLEARLTDAHPYHPSYKSRLGFTLADNAAYGPETADTLLPVLLAVKRDKSKSSFSNDFASESVTAFLLSDSDHREYRAELTRSGLNEQDYFPLPVHPWQWEEIIAPGFHQAMACGDIHVVGVMEEQYMPQQSIRTLGSRSHPQRPSLKLAMNLVNTSTSRVLASHTVQNAAPISDWLKELVARSDWPEPMARPVILREIAGINYAPRAVSAGQYGALSCIWRESIHIHLSKEETAVPMTAILHVDADGLPFIDPWIRRYGATTWLQTLVERAWLPVLYLLWKHGTALESHAQNMILLHTEGLPVRVALKDFHDGVRFSGKFLSGVPPVLTSPPIEHARVNPNSFIQTDDAAELRDFTLDALLFVSLAELAWIFERFYEMEQGRFWAVAASVINDYQKRHPELADRYALFDCFVHEIDVELLASRRFQPEIRLRTRAASNPLAPRGASA